MANTFNNAKTILATTATTDLYQAPSTAGSVSIVLSVLLANRGASGAVNASVVLTDNSNTVLSTILNACPVPQNATLESVTNKIVLKANEKLRVTAGTASLLDATLSCLEITP